MNLKTSNRLRNNGVRVGARKYKTLNVTTMNFEFDLQNANHNLNPPEIPVELDPHDPCLDLDIQTENPIPITNLDNLPVHHEPIPELNILNLKINWGPALNEFKRLVKFSGRTGVSKKSYELFQLVSHLLSQIPNYAGIRVIQMRTPVMCFKTDEGYQMLAYPGEFGDDINHPEMVDHAYLCWIKSFIEDIYNDLHLNELYCIYTIATSPTYVWFCHTDAKRRLRNEQPPVCDLARIGRYDMPKHFYTLCPEIRTLIPQDETSATDSGEAGASTTTKSTYNVDLIENRGDQVAIPAPLPAPLPNFESFSQPPEVFRKLTDRWNNLGTFQWSTGDQRGSILHVVDLPLDILPLLESNPATLPTQQYTFYRPQITMRFQMTSTRFHSGGLVLGVQYYSGPSPASGARRITHANQIWQLDYATLRASSSNIVEIKIPFRSFLDALPIRGGSYGSSSYYATVYVGVIAPLGIGQDGSQTVNITQQIQLACDGVPTEFFSQMTRTSVLAPQGNTVSNIANSVLDIAKPIADVAGAFIPGASIVGEAIGIAGGLVDNVIKPVENLFGGSGRAFPASNMDKPSYPIDAPPLLQYPTASLSWGEGPTPGRSLRLNPATTTPHHPQTVPFGGDLLRKGDLARKWSFLDSFVINTNSPAQTLLWSTPITPLASPITGNSYLPTALAGVSSQFSYWSGQLEFKFIALKADPHSFRLRISSNPTSPTTADRQIDLPSEIVDFQEINEFTLVPPYFGPTHLTPMTYAGQACALGTVQVSLENPMVSINSCSSEVEVVVLVRAHDNFELSVPRTTLYLPNITTDTTNPPEPDNENNYVIVSGKLYVRSYEIDAYGFNLKAISQVITIQDDRIVVYGRPIVRTVYYFTDNPDALTDVVGTANVWAGKAFVIASKGIPVDTKNGYRTVELKTGQGPVVTQITSDFKYPINLGPVTRTLTPQSGTEREENVIVDGPPETQRVSQSQLLLGEETTLRSSLRRYNPELSGVFTADADGEYELMIDVNYGALSARTAGSPVSNLTFNHDAFRFGKGGLSYLFSIKSSKNPNMQVRAMHIPGGLLNTYELQPSWKLAQYSVDPQNFMFAKDVVATPKTSVPVHVPYYNYTNLIVNSYDPSSAGYGAVAAYSMGKLCFSTYLYADESFTWEILRALGDDADMYCFQGWPLCVQEIRPLQLNTVIPINRNNPHSVLVAPYPKQLEPQCNTESQNSNQDFLKVPAPSNESKVISNLITEFSNTRRGRRALKVFLTQISHLQPQNQTELSPSNLSILESIRQEMIGCYNLRKPMISVFPPFALHHLDKADVALTRAPWDTTDDDMVHRRALNHIMNILATSFSNFDAVPYYKATGQEKKTQTWTSALLGSFVSTSGLIPNSLKKNLTALGEIIKGNAFFKVVAALKDTFSDLSNLNLVISCLQMILKASDMWVKSMALVMLLSHFGFLDCSQLGIAMLLNQLIYAVTPNKLNVSVMGLPTLVPQSNTDHADLVAQWVAALVAGTSAFCGLKNAKTWAGGVESFTRNLGNVGNGIHRMLTTSCRVVLDYILWLIGLENPTTLAIAELKQTNVEAADWAKRVLELVDPSRRSEVLASPTLRKEVSELYTQGAVFMRVLSEDKKRPESASTFVSIWRSLVELFGETGEMPDSVKANMPPLCIWIEGPAGIGKSEVAKRLARDVALLLNVTFDGDPFFVRTPRKFWDGFYNQPIVIFDDAMQITSPEILSQFYSDWYGLMTNAPFSPEFSAVSEKKKFVTPEVVIVCSNQAYPKVEGIATPASFYRRRDFLIHVELSKHIKDNYGADIETANDMRIPLEEIQSFNHLRFSQYSSSTDNKAKKTGCWTETELIKQMQPRIEHLTKIRRSAAEENIKTSKSLRPDTIEAARGALLKELEGLGVADTVVSNLTKSYSAITGDKPEEPEVTLEGQSGKDEHTGSVWADGPKTSKLCFLACGSIIKQNPIKCFCEIPAEHIKYSEYCTKCGCFVVRVNYKYDGFTPTSRIGDYYALGFFKGCRKSEKVSNYDKVLAASIDNVRAIGLETKIEFPPFRQNTVQIKTTVDLDVIADVEQVSTWLAMKRNLKIWSQVALRYLVPLVLGFGVLFACKIFGVFEKISKLTSLGSGPPKQPVQVEQVLVPVPQLASSGSVSTGRTQSVRHVIRSMAPQMSSEDLTKLVMKNTVKFSFTYEDGVTKHVYGLGLFDRYIALPNHIFCAYPAKRLMAYLTTFDKMRNPKVLEFEDFSCFEHQQINGTDLALLHIKSRRIPMFKDITKCLVRKEDIGKVNSNGMLIDTTRPQTTIVPLAIKWEEFNSRYDYGTHTQEFAMVGYSYPYERTGLCGSILIDSYHGWIIGMHVAGETNRENPRGYSNILTSEYFKNIVREVKDVVEPEFEAGGTVELEGNFLPLGKVLDAQACSLPLRTSIQKSICHGVIAPPTRYPVKMTTPGEPKPGLTKLKVALEKGGIPTRVWPQKYVDKAKATLTQRILTHCKPVTTAVGRRTFEEAICGVPNVPYANPLKRTSSVGWPLSTLKKGTKKGDFVKFEETSDGLKIVGVSQHLVDDYNRMHQLRVNGIVPFSPFQNFLKDERLKPGKNPRLINGSSFSQTIDTRRYSLDFVSALQNNGLEVGIGIGLNVHGFQWTNLARRLLLISDFICCGDYSGFGPGLDTELVYCAYEIINAWYEEYQTEDRERLSEDHAVRLTLAENLAFSVELSLDTMIKTLQGSPSGNDLTAVINSLVNHLMIMLVWQTVFEGTTIQEPSFLYQLCYPVVYGDDLIMSVHDSIIDQFNNEVMQKVFASVGVTYTDADKSGNIRKYCSLAESSFLKCYFVEHPTRGIGTYIGALEKNVIEDIPNWIHTCNDAEKAALENCIQACRFSYAWGHHYYLAVQSKFLEFWRSRGQTFPLESWEYLDALFFGELRGVALPKTIDPLNYSWC